MYLKVTKAYWLKEALILQNREQWHVNIWTLYFLLLTGVPVFFMFPFCKLMAITHKML